MHLPTPTRYRIGSAISTQMNGINTFVTQEIAVRIKTMIPNTFSGFFFLALSPAIPAARLTAFVAASTCASNAYSPVIPARQAKIQIALKMIIRILMTFKILLRFIMI